MYYIFFIYSSIDGSLSCFHFLAITNNAMNIYINLNVWISYLRISRKKTVYFDHIHSHSSFKFSQIHPMPAESYLFCPYTHGYMAIHRNMIDLQEDTTLKKTGFPSCSPHQESLAPQLRVGVHELFVLPFWSVDGPDPEVLCGQPSLLSSSVQCFCHVQKTLLCPSLPRYLEDVLIL